MTAALPTPRAAAWGRHVALALLALAGLYLVFGIYLTGEIYWAMAALAVLGLALYVYGSPRVLAWKYLLPGVLAMVVFVAFPLLYTTRIGFTNFSSTHLLGEQAARAYLLEQTEPREASTFHYAVRKRADGVQLALWQVDGPLTPQWVTAPFALGPAATAQPLPLQPATAADAAAAPQYTLRELIAQRDTLRALQLQLPDGTVLRYAGVREFAPLQPLWRAAPGDAVQEVATGTVYRPDRRSGFFESAQGERLQPGFKVDVGLANYARMLGDPDVRGPFLSIFVWTVVFAGLTVLFALSLGATLAVLLNWESLRFRTVYRTLLFLPYAVPAFISILVFKGLFNQNFGEINALLDAVFGIKPAWFVDPTLARTMILIVNTWLGYPYFMILCSGMLKSIPADLYEASAIAGAGPLTNFFRITLPLIIKPLYPLLISVFAYNFNNFTVISLLTNGRPDYLNTKLPAGTTDILVSYTYRIAFLDSGQNYGLAAAISTMIFFVVALLSFANLRLTKLNRGAA